MAISIEKELTLLSQIPGFGQHLANALRILVTGVNQLGTNTGSSPNEVLPAPNPVQQLTVKTNGNGLVHAVISDNNAITKNLHYFVEYDTDPAFPKPHVVHLGASRSMNPLNLPANDDNGNPQQFYFRAYSQYPGGDPGQVVKFGGNIPSPVAPGGSQNMTLIPSTGSGTAQNTGEQGGSGFGKIVNRPGPAPKRQS